MLQYDVHPGGTLAPKSPTTVPAGAFATGLGMTADGRNLYVANSGDGSVSQYLVRADGSLSPRSPAAVPAGASPLEVAVGPASPRPSSKDQCKHGGWRQFGFKNQGQCVSSVTP